MPSTPYRDAGTELRRALEPSSKALWESVNPHIPYDLTLEEAERGTVEGGMFRLHPDDVAARAGGRRAA
jgi:hypothetical protein